jgi:predicted ATPase
MIEKRNFFLFTGSPGVGKTTLIQHLRVQGHRCVEESHRRVIREQVASGGRHVPWLDQAGYLERVAREDLGLPRLDPAHDRLMLCGGPSVLADLKTQLESYGYEEGSLANPGDYVLERAFVES